MDPQIATDLFPDRLVLHYTSELGARDTGRLGDGAWLGDGIDGISLQAALAIGATLSHTLMETNATRNSATISDAVFGGIQFKTLTIKRYSRMVDRSDLR